MSFSEVDPDNIQEVTEDQLKVEDKAEFDERVEAYKRLCLSLFSLTKSGAIKKAPLPGPQHVTFTSDPGKLQEMMDEAVRRTFINQSTVLDNTIQNTLLKTLKEGLEQGYVGPAYFQPTQSNVKISEVMSAPQPISNQDAEASPSEQILLYQWFKRHSQVTRM